MKIDISPPPFFIAGVNVGLSSVTGSIIVIVLIIAFFFIGRSVKRFENLPTGFQNVLELMVDTMDRFALSKTGHYAENIAPFVMALMVYIMVGSLIENFGVPAITGDLSCTIALGVTSFVLTNVIAFHALGFAGRFKALMQPSVFIFPLKLLTDLIAPLSMALRLFANILAGSIIMHLVKSVIPIFLPAVVGSYFTLIHPLIQVYVFGLLSLNYIQEALEAGGVLES